jgi:hypothetical protein
MGLVMVLPESMKVSVRRSHCVSLLSQKPRRQAIYPATRADLAAECDALDSKWRGCVSFDLVSVGEWGSKAGRWASDQEALKQRARETRKWLREKMKQLSLSDSHTPIVNGEKQYIRGDCVLVTHGGFLHILTEDWEGFDVKAGQLGFLAFISPMPSLLHGTPS